MTSLFSFILSALATNVNSMATWRVMGGKASTYSFFPMHGFSPAKQKTGGGLNESVQLEVAEDKFRNR